MPDNRRISLFVPTLQDGGAERVLVNIAGGLVAKGHDVDLVLLKAVGPWLEDVDPEVRVLELGARRVLTGIPRLAKYLRRERPDVLLSTLSYANVAALLAAKLSRVPVRVLVREASTFSGMTEPGADFKWKAVLYFMRRTYPWAAAVVAPSRDVRDDLLRHQVVAAEKIRTINNPLPPSCFERPSQPPDHPWLTNKDRPVLLAVGRLTDPKDYPTLLRAFRLVRDREACRLLILGEGEDRGTLQTLADSLGLTDDLDMPGFVRNPSAYMNYADVFVLSSKREGFVNVLLEALAAGASVVSTNCAGGPAEILDDGTYGRIVPVGDSQQLAAAILETMHDRPDGELLRSRAADFSLDKVIDEYREIMFPDVQGVNISV